MACVTPESEICLQNLWGPSGFAVLFKVTPRQRTFLFEGSAARRPAVGDVQGDVFQKTLLRQLEEIDRFYLLQDQSCFYLFKGPVTGERIEH